MSLTANLLPANDEETHVVLLDELPAGVEAEGKQMECIRRIRSRLC